AAGEFGGERIGWHDGGEYVEGFWNVVIMNGNCGRQKREPQQTGRAEAHDHFEMRCPLHRPPQLWNIWTVWDWVPWPLVRKRRSCSWAWPSASAFRAASSASARPCAASKPVRSASCLVCTATS